MLVVVRFALVCFAIALSPICNAEVVAFVGSPIGARILDSRCSDYMPESEDPGVEVICMDRVIALEYELHRSIRGELSEPTQHFIAFYHYDGLPLYLSYAPAVIVLRERDDLRIAVRIKSAEKNANGDYQVCTNRTNDDEFKCLKWVSALSYVENVTNDN